MLERLPRLHGDVAAMRICVTKSEASQMMEIGILPEDLAANRAYFGNHDVSLESHLEYIFAKKAQRAKSASRFTDGTIPVFYTALEVETAQAEKAHWLKRADGAVKFQLVAIDFLGAHKDLRALEPIPMYLTAEASAGAYQACLTITIEAVADQLDGFQTPSVRYRGGSCFPILTRRSVRALRPRGFIRFEYDDGAMNWRCHAL